MFPLGSSVGARGPTGDGQTGATWAPDEQARARELAMAVGDLGIALALAWWLVCWGFASDPANGGRCGAWARPKGGLLGVLVAQAGDERTWRNGMSPGGDMRGEMGAALASTSK